MSAPPEGTGALAGLRVVSLAVNVPGPVAAARLRDLGADVTKVEPLSGDPLREYAEDWYHELARGQTVRSLDLKSETGEGELRELLEGTDLLLTSSRPASLERLGLGLATLRARFPRLCHLAILGYGGADADRAGHDLTYLAPTGLATPPDLPRTLLADLAAAERAVSAALALLLQRERTGEAGHATVTLADAADELARPWRHGLTRPGALLGGGSPGYGYYETADGWLAVAALEPHFLERLRRELGLAGGSPAGLAAAFRLRTAAEWEGWARERDLPIAAVAG